VDPRARMIVSLWKELKGWPAPQAAVGFACEAQRMSRSSETKGSISPYDFK